MEPIYALLIFTSVLFQLVSSSVDCGTGSTTAMSSSAHIRSVRETNFIKGCAKDCSQNTNRVAGQNIFFNCSIGNLKEVEHFKQTEKCFHADPVLDPPTLNFVDFYLREVSGEPRSPSLSINFTLPKAAPVVSDSGRITEYVFPCAVIMQFESIKDPEVQDDFYYNCPRQRIFNFHNYKTTLGYEIANPRTLSFDCFVGLNTNKVKRVYLITLRSIPGRNITYTVTVNVMSREDDPSTWRPAIVTHFNATDDSLYVVWERPPTAYTVYHYIVTLKNHYTGEVEQEQIVRKEDTTVAIHNIRGGKYFVEVSINGQFEKKEGIFVNGTSYPIDATVLGGNDSENPINYLVGDDITKMVAMGIGCVAGMVLIIGTAFIIRRRSLCEEDKPITGAIPAGFILHPYKLPEDQRIISVLEKLADYLHEVGRCSFIKFIVPDDESKFQTFYDNSLSASSFVFVVIRNDQIRENPYFSFVLKECVKTREETNRMRIIPLIFNFNRSCRIPPIISSIQSLKLMDEFEQLYCKVQSVEKVPEGLKRAFNKNTYRNHSDKGKLLFDALNNNYLYTTLDDQLSIDENNTSVEMETENDFYMDFFKDLNKSDTDLSDKKNENENTPAENLCLPLHSARNKRTLKSDEQSEATAPLLEQDYIQDVQVIVKIQPPKAIPKSNPRSPSYTQRNRHGTNQYVDQTEAQRSPSCKQRIKPIDPNEYIRAGHNDALLQHHEHPTTSFPHPQYEHPLTSLPHPTHKQSPRSDSYIQQQPLPLPGRGALSEECLHRPIPLEERDVNNHPWYDYHWQVQELTPEERQYYMACEESHRIQHMECRNKPPNPAMLNPPCQHDQRKSSRVHIPDFTCQDYVPDFTKAMPTPHHRNYTQHQHHNHSIDFVQQVPLDHSGVHNFLTDNPYLPYQHMDDTAQFPRQHVRNPDGINYEIDSNNTIPDYIQVDGRFLNNSGTEHSTQHAYSKNVGVAHDSFNSKFPNRVDPNYEVDASQTHKSSYFPARKLAGDYKGSPNSDMDRLRPDYVLCTTDPYNDPMMSTPQTRDITQAHHEFIRNVEGARAKCIDNNEHLSPQQRFDNLNQTQNPQDLCFRETHRNDNRSEGYQDKRLVNESDYVAHKNPVLTRGPVPPANQSEQKPNAQFGPEPTKVQKRREPKFSFTAVDPPEAENQVSNKNTSNNDATGDTNSEDKRNNLHFPSPKPQPENRGHHDEPSDFMKKDPNETECFRSRGPPDTSGYVQLDKETNEIICTISSHSLPLEFEAGLAMEISMLNEFDAFQPPEEDSSDSDSVSDVMDKLAKINKYR